MLRCMHRTNIYLDDEQCEKLDRIAEDEGRSRSEVIRELITRGLGGDDGDLEEDLAAIGSSFGSAEDIEVATRAGDERSEHLDSVWQG
jgi:metal-responsive CopG/Arc/MetJ family transcriptional regulator